MINHRLSLGVLAVLLGCALVFGFAHRPAANENEPECLRIVDKKSGRILVLGKTETGSGDEFFGIRGMQPSGALIFELSMGPDAEADTAGLTIFGPDGKPVTRIMRNGASGCSIVMGTKNLDDFLELTYDPQQGSRITLQSPSENPTETMTHRKRVPQIVLRGFDKDVVTLGGEGEDSIGLSLWRNGKGFHSGFGRFALDQGGKGVLAMIPDRDSTSGIALTADGKGGLLETYGPTGASQGKFPVK